MRAPRLVTAALLALACALTGPAMAGTIGSGTASPALQPFTATYKVLRGGKLMGTSNLSLVHNQDGSWTFSSHLVATHGMVALAGAKVGESSRFRARAGHIESLDYNYRLRMAFHNRQRKVNVDWATHKVTVDSSHSGKFSYATQPDLVERHVLILALGLAAARHQQTIALPVAVKDRVQTQTFQAQPAAPITVPAGSFTAVRINRTHDDKGYSIWFAPNRLGAVPVKLKQDEGGDITLLLVQTATAPTATPAG